MILIISGTDRKDSLSLVLAKHYESLFLSRTQETVKILSLHDLPPETFQWGIYKKEDLSAAFILMEDTLLVPATKLFFIVPEYNGSYPGALKYFIDLCSLRSKMLIFKKKKAGLVGVATGKSGNIRGLEHLGSVLNFMDVITLPNKLPVSLFDKALDKTMTIVDPVLLKTLEAHAEDFIQF